MAKSLSSQQFGEDPEQQWALNIINDPNTPPVVHGPTARRIMRAANIRSWPIDSMASDYKGDTFDMNGSRGSLSAHEVVNTAQSHLHIPTLRKYIGYDEPETDEDTGLAYNPEVAYNLDTGRIWMDEGHHRMVASRLRGDLSREVWSGTFRMRSGRRSR